MADDLNIRVDLTKPMPALPAITAEKLDQYITHLALTGKKRQSAMLALIEPQSLWRYRKDHGELAEREAEALAFYAEWMVEEIEAAMYKRGIKGVTEPVFYEGDKCGHKRVYSDRLLMMLAKRHIPEYRDHVTVDANLKAGVLVVNTPMTMDEWTKQYEKQGNPTLEQNVPAAEGVADERSLSGRVRADPDGRPDSGDGHDHCPGADGSPGPNPQPGQTGDSGPGGDGAG